MLLAASVLLYRPSLGGAGDRQAVSEDPGSRWSGPPELRYRPAWVGPFHTYSTLSFIHFSSWLVIFCLFHSVRFATKTPGLNEQVLAFIESLRILSFL